MPSALPRKRVQAGSRDDIGPAKKRGAQASIKKPGSRLPLPPSTRGTTQGQAGQDAQPLVHSVIDPLLGTSTEQCEGGSGRIVARPRGGSRSRIQLEASGVGDAPFRVLSGLLSRLLRRWPKAIEAHVQPAQGRAVEQVERQGHALEAEDRG